MQKRLKLYTLLFFGILLGLIESCKKDESFDDLVLPSNLIVELLADSSQAGLIHIKAKASNTNFYSFSYVENGKSTYEENTTGKSNHHYKSSGNYSIKVRAHALQDKYIEELKAVELSLNSDSVGNYSEFPSNGYTSPRSYTGYNLVWNDEFNGTLLSSQDWNIEIGTGNGGWGNNESQHYLQENLTVENGVLTIEAKNETYNTSSYTSSRITTQNKQSFQYGRIDIRAAMPNGQGIWPALWMLGNDITSKSWPKCGEIDIMEMVGGTSTPNRGDNVCHGTAHWHDGRAHAELNGNTKAIKGKLADEFYVYSIIWDSNSIRWFLNDRKYHSIDITPNDLSEFHQKFFFIFNVAVGGNWPGSPDNETTFPQKMYIDYIRVFQK